MKGTLIAIFYFIIMALIGNGKKAAKKRVEKDVAQPQKTTAKRAARSFRGAVADDGHVLTGKDDPTCRRFGHKHLSDMDPRYIVHDEPLGQDYITLNGMRVRLKDADKYFCR